VKLLAALLGFAIVGIAAVLLYPRLIAPREPSRLPRSTGDRTEVTEAPKPGKALESPRPREEEVREEFSRRRLPFYRFLRANYGKVVEHFGVTQGLDTLDLVVNRTDEETLRTIISMAVGPSAKEYGFRKVRFLAPNPPGSVDPLTLVAESTVDDTGHWNTFKK